MEQTNYIEIIIPGTDEEQRALLIAELAEIGYDGFEETDQQLKAYISESDYSEEQLNDLLDARNTGYTQSVLQKQNWNALWESNFEPVQVDGFVGIRAAFHPPFTGVEHELIITPKMSFGTGHHATTWLVMQLMQGIDFTGKTVFDFGTGTGILAILAARLGAKSVLAVDNDDWCIENAIENISLNQVQGVEIRKAGTAENGGCYDIVIANINRNIILDNLEPICASLEQGGTLVLSGLLAGDEAEIVAAFAEKGLQHLETRERKGWIAIRLQR